MRESRGRRGGRNDSGKEKEDMLWLTRKIKKGR